MAAPLQITPQVLELGRVEREVPVPSHVDEGQRHDGRIIEPHHPIRNLEGQTGPLFQFVSQKQHGRRTAIPVTTVAGQRNFHLERPAGRATAQLNLQFRPRAVQRHGRTVNLPSGPQGRL